MALMETTGASRYKTYKLDQWQSGESSAGPFSRTFVFLFDVLLSLLNLLIKLPKASVS